MTAIKPKKTTPFFNFLFISMASLLILTLFSLFLFFTLSSAHHHHHKLPSSIVPPEIHSACKATRYPQKCESALIQFGHLPRNPNPIQIIQSSIQMFQHGVTEAQSKFRKILEASKHNITRYIAAKNALDTLKNCQYRISSTSNALLPHSEYRLSSTSETTNSLPSHSEYRLSSTNNYLLPRGKIKDARAWLSAASSFTFGTWSGLKNLVDNPLINETMTFLDELVMVGSNALNMVRAYDIFGNGTGSWAPPKTERDGFWEGVGDGYGSGDVIRGVPVGLTANVTVCSRGGGCNYTTVQTAVDGAPVNETRRFVIRIKEGVYDEIVRVPLEKRNLVFLGDGMGKTVITGNLNVGQPGVSTYNSATLGVLGDGFMARDLTVQNTAGPVAYQAVAFRSDSDLSIIENCEFLGNQDTLYVHGLRQFYKSCRIEGNVDFIFGNSASIFQNCLILLRPRQLNPTKGENNAVTAHSRSDPAQSTGLVFHNCVINGTEEYMKLYHSKPSVHKNFLGRPWKEFSRTVFINCVLEALISPQGWMPWSGDFALKTLYYGEFRNSGPGCNTSGRVPWSSQVPAEHVNAYSVKNFIQGDEWIPTSS